MCARVPTTWDESKALDGEIGKYVVVARRKGDVWYVGGMCDWDGKEYELDFSRFLPAGEYDAFVIRDSVNSNRIPQDSVRETLKISSSGKMKISMKKGGGFAIKIVPRKVLGIF